MAQLVGRPRPRKRTTQCSNTDQRWDHFSDLPEAIIHHIFSFLEMNDLARIGAVSRRCRQMFICSPYLKFRSTCSYDGPPNLCKQFSDHVDRLLSQRNGLEIRCLCLHWACLNDNCEVDLTLIDKWVNVAVSCQAQEIDLEVGITEYPFFELEEIPIFELPKCVFSSKTLRVLKLDMQYKCLKEPTGVFVSLEDLTLTAIIGSDSEGSLKKLITTACPSLKRLTIVNLDDVKNLSVITPSLEELTLIDLPYDLLDIDISTQGLQKLYLDLDSLFAGYLCTMKIDAPNLQDLRWKAGTLNTIYLSQFRCLKNAKISVGVSDSFVDEPTICNRITELLQGVCCTRTLQLDINVLETQYLQDCLSFGFDYLQHLVITVNGCLKDYHFPVLASVIMQSPKLEALSLSCTGSRLEPDYARELKLKASEVCKQHEGFHNLIGHQLNAIEIELKGKGHEFGVLENMRKVAKGLKKMTIFYSKENCYLLSEIGLHNSRTASLPFEVNLVEKEFYIEDPLGIRYFK